MPARRMAGGTFGLATQRGTVDPCSGTSYTTLEPHVQVQRLERKGNHMDAKYPYARGNFFSAIRILAASSESIQTRLIEANDSILAVTIDEFEGDIELKLKFARILDLLAVDRDEIELVAVENAAHMSDVQAIKLAELICEFFYELG